MAHDTASSEARTQQAPMSGFEKPILTLEPNITLRLLRPSDAESLSHHGNNEKIAARMSNTFPRPYTIERAREWIVISRGAERFIASGPFDARVGDGTGPKLSTNYAICIDDNVVGGIGMDFRDIIRLRTANMGYWLGEEHWGKGVMSKVVPAFARWCIDTWGRLVRIDGGVYVGNPASCKVLLKCGLSHVRLAKKAVHKNGKDLDVDEFEWVRGD